MRILIAHNTSLARSGGMSRLMGNIHDHVVSAGHTVDYFTADDANHLTARTARFSFPWLIRNRVAEARRRGQPYDILNVHEPESGLFNTLCPSKRDFKLVVTSHGLEEQAWKVSCEDAAMRGQPVALKTKLTQGVLRNWSCRAGIKSADAVLCLSESDRRYIVEKFKVPEKNILRVFPGASATFRHSANARSYSHVKSLLFAGTWIERKGIRELITAFESLARSYTQLELTVLGAGMPEDEIKSCFSADLHSRIFVRTAANDHQTSDYFYRADIFLLPSLFEGTPLTLIEGMMTGIPIVATSVCGIKDVIDDGANGLLVPPRSPSSLINAVQRLLQSQDLRRELGSRAFTNASQKYTWDRVSTPVLEKYCALRAA
jgi:glycosyltransferase involved in cell wall biosynthesis